MEFPDLGKHCSESTCKQLDFLPLQCDTCAQAFCKDHVAHAAHKCPFAFKKDVQVPVCPLCDRPVPVKRGEIPDAVVGEHIDRDCKLRPRKEEKIFTYRCSKGGCKKKEMLPVACDQCGSNFCLRHRHPLDHSCARGRSPVSVPGPEGRRRHACICSSRHISLLFCFCILSLVGTSGALALPYFSQQRSEALSGFPAQRINPFCKLSPEKGILRWVELL